MYRMDCEYNCVDDEIDGELINYYEDGNIKSKHSYVDYILDKIVDYDVDGEIIGTIVTAVVGNRRLLHHDPHTGIFVSSLNNSTSMNNSTSTIRRLPDDVIARFENREQKHVKLCKGLLNDKEDMDCAICGDEKSCYTFFKCSHKCCFDCFIQMNKYQCYYNCDQDENESLYESDFETASEQDQDDVEPEEQDQDDVEPEELEQEETGQKMCMKTFYLNLNGKEVNNNIKEVYNYLDYKRHGEHLFYNENGSIREINRYVNGELHGESVTYHDNGNINQISNFVDGERHGENIFYDKDGNVRFKINYVDGKEQEQ